MLNFDFINYAYRKLFCNNYFSKASFIKFFFSSLILKFAIQINKKHLYIMAFDIEMIKKCMKT
jgi:hypothetical protein